MNKKIALIGAGQIGGTLAHLIGLKELANEVILFDVAKGIAKGKALDIEQSSSIDGFNVKISGTDNYQDIKNSDVIIVTAGVPRKPGMSRDDLLLTNMKIVGSVTAEVAKYSPNAVLIVVSNPLDAMVQHAYNVSGFPKERVIGMAGILDTARFRTFLSQELNASVTNVSAYVLGGHGDTMVPLIGSTTVGGVPVSKLIEATRLEEIVQRTRDGGAEIVALLKTGSAYYAPSAAVAQMTEAILLDRKEILPCAAFLEGEYGINGLYAGVPVKLGAKGIEEIIEVELTNDESAALNASAESVQELVDIMAKA